MTMGSFLTRFVHPWVAAIALAGAGLWLISFAVAATGVALRSTHGLLAIDLFFASGVLGLVGMATLAGCGLWLAGVRTKQVLDVQRS